MEMLKVSYIFPPNKMIDEIKENRAIMKVNTRGEKVKIEIGNNFYWKALVKFNKEQKLNKCRQSR